MRKGTTPQGRAYPAVRAAVSPRSPANGGGVGHTPPVTMGAARYPCSTYCTARERMSAAGLSRGQFHPDNLIAAKQACR
jgi:hypothetical protein